MKVSAATTVKPQISDAVASKPKTSFSDKIKAKKAERSTPIEQTVEKAITQITTDHKRVERAMRKAMRGAEISQPELLHMQALLYRYQQEVDLASKVVEKTTNGFKQIMNTQV